MVGVRQDAFFVVRSRRDPTAIKPAHLCWLPTQVAGVPVSQNSGALCDRLRPSLWEQDTEFLCRKNSELLKFALLEASAIATG